MKKFLYYLFLYLVKLIYTACYIPTWDSLDSRPLPLWYDESKIGIFIHWGVFSVPAFKSEWFWWYLKGENKSEFVNFMSRNYKHNFTYPEFATKFTANDFDPVKWSKLFKKSGAKYVVLTSKHHEGFCLWPSKFSWNWNSFDIGPMRDLVGELAIAIRNVGLKFGVYHSLYEWFNPLYLQDKKNNWKTQKFVSYKIKPELIDLVNKYEPEIIWSDGDWEAQDSYWNSKEFLTWLYNESPVKDSVVTNDRWGIGTICKHGGYLTCSDRYQPKTLLQRKWENAMTLDKNSWGYVSSTSLSGYLSIQELLETLIKTISYGGNLLVNVGPTKDGIIIPIMEERLEQMGNWLSINGEAIYASTPWIVQNDSFTPHVWYTKKADSTVYTLFTNWPRNNILILGSVKISSETNIFMLHSSGYIKLNWEIEDNFLKIHLLPTISNLYAWALKIEPGFHRAQLRYY